MRLKGDEDTCEVSRTLPGTAVGLEDRVALHSPLRPPEAEFHVSGLRAVDVGSRDTWYT